MDPKFNDIGDGDCKNSFRPDSIIWHSKKGHFNNDRFQAEFRHYLKIGKALFDGKQEI